MATRDDRRRSREREYEEGLVVIQEMVNKLNTILQEGTQSFTSADYMRFYTTIYNLTIAHPIREYSPELYEKYKETFEEHINYKVLPSLRGKKDQDLLQELATKWANYKIMTRWLFRFFHYLDRYFIRNRRLPSLQETSFIAFYNLVYGEINEQVRNTVISMINQERNGEVIDQDLVKSTVTIYVEMGIESMKYYERDLEASLLKESAAFYSEKASKWIQNESYEDYMYLVERCLKHEKEIVSSYLPATTQDKIIQVVEHELLQEKASELEGKKMIW